jgi:uncharacterized membrane protein (UPF0127 family)
MVKQNSGTKIVLDIIIFSVITLTAFFIYQGYGRSVQNIFFGEDTVYTVYINNVAVVATVADTVQERKLGLSGVTELPELGGKLFIFDTPARHGIWMKDMLFPIDIMWFNNELELVHTEEDVDPSTYPAIFSPEEDARFVLETNAHFIDSLRIQVGDRLTLPSSILPKDVKENLQE